MKKMFATFSYALNGLKIFWKEERNGRIHLISAFLVILLGIFTDLNAIEWIIVLSASGLVITAELFNTTIEAIMDFISPEKHVKIKKIKDLAAAGVLITAITAFVLGLVLFVPKLL